VDLFDEFSRIIDLLNANGIEYPVCGGVAVNLLGHVRATRDIDLLVRKPDVDRVRELVKSLGFVLPRAVFLSPRGPRTPESVARLSLRGQFVAEPRPDGRDEGLRTRVRASLHWRGRPLQVVSAAGLIAMKRLAGRPQDLADIAVLEGAGDS